MIPSNTTLMAALGALSLAGASGTSGAEPSSESLFPNLPKALADYDGDGRLDALALAADGTPRLLRNLGAAGFEDATAASGLTAIGAAQGASWHDIDGDGRVDLTLFTPEGGVRVLYNSAGGLFAEGTEGSGLEHAQGIVAARWADLDGDGLSELWVADDQGEQLWHNTGDGTFAELPLPGEDSGGGLSLSLGGGGYTIVSASAPPANSVCLPRVVDQAGGCLEASSVPTPGQLFTFTTSTIPGLSADLIDGVDSSSFSQLGQTIEGSEITNSSITGSDVADESLTGADIEYGTILASDIANGAINTFHLANETIRSEDVDDGSLMGSDLAQNSINTGHLASSAVTTIDIALGAVNSGRIQADAINSSHIGANQVGASDLALFEITNAHISGLAGISGSKISSHFGAQDLTTDQELGVGTVNPLADVHVVGSPTMGTVMITPDEPVGGDNAELILGETDAGDYGMRVAYDGGLNQMFIGGVYDGVNSTHWRLTRDTGRIGIGTAPLVDTRVHINDDNRYGLRVTADSTYSGITYGVYTDNSGVDGIAIYGKASNPNAGEVAIKGECSAPLGFGMVALGGFASTGFKLFSQPHPLDAGKQVSFASLEGNESGTYFRGSSKLFGGQAIIDVPEDFRLVSEEDGLTVQVTAVGMPAALYVVSKDLNQIVVRAAGGSTNVDFDYFVNGIRRGYELDTVVENRFFVPTERGVPFGTQYPDAVRQILVDNGTLNPDFTPNEATAAAEGWVLEDPLPAGSMQAQEAPVD